MRWMKLILRNYELPLVTVLLIGLSVCDTAHAQPRSSQSDGPSPLDTEGAWDHLELSMGFIAGGRDFSALSFEGGQRYQEMLEAEPFDGVAVLGLRYDLRLVVSYVRMTVGVDVPFSTYDVAATRRAIEGVDTTVVGLRSWNLHFGIGAEYPVGAVAPFIDVLGGIGRVKATLASGDTEETLRGRGFGFALRGGLRLHVRKWFFAAISAEVGLVGDVQWGTELSVGFAVM